ncbi:hypothetical protein CDL12_18259 [Handroanthus impetiginosus]|uniref:Myb/SANT-like domain-containing protein n=1 Tax=Handroanthus impetiginosus TaxID=429701 RepID=A0A2G9GV85_9LAMI|nr:hypothetical protein CDL12_18259 [Handroanthus impetiginosus]
MQHYIPGTDIKAEPHISSKYSSWKKVYSQLYQCLSTSGFNWDSTNHTIDASLDVWEVYLKVYPKANTLRGKAWPFYESWIEIYGKDRATNNEDDGNNSCADTPRSTTNKMRRSSSKKRKASEKDDNDILEVIGGFCDRAATSLDNAARTIGVELIASQRREDVYNAIGNLSMTISPEDHLRASYIFAMNTKAIDMFYGLPNHAKIGMVTMALDEKLNWFPN